MAITLNLLPPELEADKNLNSFLKTIKSLGVIGIVAFLIFGAGLAIFFISSTISLNGVNANIKSLSGQISAQQKSEQQVILIKDRLEKIADIQGFPSSLTNLTKIDPFLTNLSASGSVNQLDILPTSINLSVKLQSYNDLSNFIDSLESSDKFRSVTLESFNMNPNTGYSVEIKTSDTGK